MDGYQERTWSEDNSTVRVSPAIGEADISVDLEAGNGMAKVEIVTRVSRENLPRLIDDLMACVMFDERAALLAQLIEKWS